MNLHIALLQSLKSKLKELNTSHLTLMRIKHADTSRLVTIHETQEHASTQICKL